MPLFDDAKMFWRFASGLRAFLRSPLSPGQCRSLVEDSLRNRERNFLRLVERAVYGWPRSPYLPLLRWAGVEFGDLAILTEQDGVEGALEKLYEAGVHISLEQFKGRQPIGRNGLHVAVSSEDFDNPLLARDFEVASGGSTGVRRRSAIDFDLLVYDAACKFLFHQAHGMETWPSALWRALPPGSSGLKNALVFAKFGHPLERWFTPTRNSWTPSMSKSAVFTHTAVWGGRLAGGHIPRPEYVPLENPLPVAAWLAEKSARGTPALLSVPGNSAVRVAAAARDAGLDIAGTVFRLGGEPFTGAKAKIVYGTGARTVSGWAMSESGPLGGGCANREAIDEVHLFRGKMAVLQRPRSLYGGEMSVDALFLSTLLTTTPKVMLNVDTGDYGVLSKRRCGCPLESLGLDLHLHTIRNYEKLTTGGMHFMGSEILRLVEEVLPAEIGGGPTDFQFVEEQGDALNRVNILVSPRVGPVDEQAVIRVILRFLGSHSRGDRAMAEQWERGGVLRVVRAEPVATAVAKIPPLRVVQKLEDRP